MPDPYFENFQAKTQALVFNLDEEDGDKKYDLGALILFNKHGK